MDTIIVGRQPVLEALKAHQDIRKVFIQHGTGGPAIQQIKDHARRMQVPV